jgi:hypothetical protein
MAVEEAIARSKDGVPREKASRCEERSKNHHSRPKTIEMHLL